MRRKNDILWKGMMEEIFDDLLRFLFPGIDQIVDIDKGFSFLDKELSEIYPEPGKEADTKFVDKLVKVHRLDGTVEWFLVHLEVQGYPDKQFAERMFQYYYRILDRYRKPVTALAIFTGRNGKKMPGCYTYTFLGTSLVYKYNVCYITDYSDETLMNSANPFALVVLAAKMALTSQATSDQLLMDKKLLIARLLYRNGIFSKRKIMAVLGFLSNYVLFKDPQTNCIFEEQLDHITGKTNPMGIIEQLAEMRAEEIAEKIAEKMAEKIAEKKAEKKAEEKVFEERETFAKRLLADTSFSSEKIASLAGVPLATVEKIRTGR